MLKLVLASLIATSASLAFASEGAGVGLPDSSSFGTTYQPTPNWPVGPSEGPYNPDPASGTTGSGTPGDGCHDGMGWPLPHCMPGNG